jgi:hypothetical protein
VKSRVAILRINGSRRSGQGHVAQGSLGVRVQRIGIREFGILEVIGTGQRKSRNPEVTWHGGVVEASCQRSTAASGIDISGIPWW